MLEYNHVSCASCPACITLRYVAANLAFRAAEQERDAARHDVLRYHASGQNAPLECDGYALDITTTHRKERVVKAGNVTFVRVRKVENWRARNQQTISP